MCGIAGIIRPRAGEEIRAMTEAILHRGPDEDGYHIDDYVGLGMRRLSIIDLGGGHQPISSRDGRYLIFFNGEIYNYKELKQELIDYQFKTESDTEVVLAGFINWGNAVWPKLRGMFGLAIYDLEKKEITLARDFFGIKPIYYWASPSASFEKSSDVASQAWPDFPHEVIGFASEIKSFLALPGFKPEVNDEAVYNYLSYQYNPLTETFFKGVYKLPPAHYMTVSAETGEFEIERYSQLEFAPDSNLNEDGTRDKILETMEDSVAHHMIADVPVGSFLSGGIDSSIIATLMQKVIGDSKIKTFTVGFDTLSEGTEAKETAEPLGTEHTEITVGAQDYFEALPKAVWHFDEPVADPSAIGLYFLAREARKHVKVVLSGEGADELFGGYNIYLEPFARQHLAWLPRPILQFLSKLPIRGHNYAKRALVSVEESYIGNASVFAQDEVTQIWYGAQVERFSLKNLYSGTKHLSDSTKMQYIDVNTWLVGDILAKADKMTMAHSLELRVPFLDRKVADLARTLPDKFKWRGGKTKYLLREAFKNILPETTRTRRKLGFPTPVREWLRTGPEEVFETIFGNIYIRKNFDTEMIKRLVAEHRSGSHDHSRKLYLLLMLALWYNTFIDVRHS